MSPAGGSAQRGEQAARRILARWPQPGSQGIDLDALARRLGVEVETSKGLGPLARWHRLGAQSGPLRLWEEEAQGLDIVQIRVGSHQNARRYALAHELGHAVLDRELEGRSNELPVEEQERFADAFAAELLLPRSVARRLRSGFRELGEAVEVVQLAQSIAAPPRVLMLRAKQENWLAGLDVLWLDIRTIANRSTGRDQRPRLYDCICDRGRWFLPKNRSVRGLFGNDRWLATDAREMTVRSRIDVSRPRGRPARLVHEDVSAEVSAFRMRPAGDGFGPEVIAQVHLRPEDR